MKSIFMAAALLGSVSAYAQSSISNGDFFVNPHGDVVRINRMTRDRGSMHSDLQIHGSDGQTYREHDAWSAGSFKAEQDHEYLAVEKPTAHRDQAPKVMIQRVMEKLKDRSGTVVAYVVAEERRSVVVQAKDIKSSGGTLVAGSDIVDFVRQQPKEKIVDFTWGTLENGLNEMHDKKSSILVDLVKAAQTRRNYTKSDLAGMKGVALSGLSLRWQPELVKLLAEGVDADLNKRAAKATTSNREVVREAVGAAEGAR